MAENSGRNWRDILWQLFKPALVAAIVALLVALGVTALRQPGLPADGLGVLSNTTFSGPLFVTGGIQSGNNITMGAGSLINSKGAITVTDHLWVTRDVFVVGNMTVTTLISSSNGFLSTGGGGLDVAGNISMSNGYLVSTKGGVTVTDQLYVTSQVQGVNGLLLTGNITNTGSLSVTGVASLYGQVWGVGSTQAITANYGITPTTSGVVYVTDDGGQATGTVTLSATTSIVDGTTVGQVLLIMYIDTAGATMTIKDNANVQLPGNTDLALGLNDSVLVMWNGTDWIAFGSTDN